MDGITLEGEYVGIFTAEDETHCQEWLS